MYLVWCFQYSSKYPLWMKWVRMTLLAFDLRLQLPEYYFTYYMIYIFQWYLNKFLETFISCSLNLYIAGEAELSQCTLIQSSCSSTARAGAASCHGKFSDEMIIPPFCSWNNFTWTCGALCKNNERIKQQQILKFD